jgi:hypothetical protein
MADLGGQIRTDTAVGRNSVLHAADAEERRRFRLEVPRLSSCGRQISIEDIDPVVHRGLARARSLQSSPRSPQFWNRPRSPAAVWSPIRLQLRLSLVGTGLEITLGMNGSETRPNGDLMRKLIAALLAGLMVSSSVIFAAEADTAGPLAVIAPRELEKSARPLITAAAREAMRVAPVPSAFRQTPAEQSPPETKPWMERHPVWSGLIAGASVGAAWGALSCRDGCFPIGAGVAAMAGSWWGAGAGALIGFGIGRAK